MQGEMESQNENQVNNEVDAHHDSNEESQQAQSNGHDNESQQDNHINYGQLRKKYQERGKKEGYEEALQKMIEAGILDENGNPIQQSQSMPAQNNAQSQVQDEQKIYQAMQTFQDVNNIQKLGNNGKSEYKDWQEVAEFFQDDLKHDNAAEDIIRTVASYPDGHAILHYLYQNNNEFEKLKQYRPAALNTAIRNLVKNMQLNKTKEIPADPLKEAKGSLSSASTGKSKYERMQEAKKYLSNM